MFTFFARSHPPHQATSLSNWVAPVWTNMELGRVASEWDICLAFVTPTALAWETPEMHHVLRVSQRGHQNHRTHHIQYIRLEVWLLPGSPWGQLWTLWACLAHAMVQSLVPEYGHFCQKCPSLCAEKKFSFNRKSHFPLPDNAEKDFQHDSWQWSLVLTTSQAFTLQWSYWPTLTLVAECNVMLVPKCIFAKCTWLACLLSFASLFPLFVLSLFPRS